MIPPEIIEVAVIVGAAAGSAFVGGRSSMNGLRAEVGVVRQEIGSVSDDIKRLMKTDGAHEARLASLERVVERRLQAEEVEVERRDVD